MADTPPTDALRKFQENHPDLYRKGLPLWEQGAGVAELAWNRTDVLEVIEALERDGQCILGGDVWEVVEGIQPTPSHANWYFDPSGQRSDSWASKEIAERYIESYPQTGDSVHFVLVWRPAAWARS